MTLRVTTELALVALMVNRVRTALAMLGVIIGVGAVVTMMSVGAGARARVEEQIRSLGSNLIIVISGSITTSGVRLGSGSELTVTEDDAKAMEREIASVQVAAPMVRGGAQVVVGNANWSTAIIGLTPGGLEARDWFVSSGRPLTDDDVEGATKVALLGHTVVDNLTTQGQDQDDVVLLPLSTAKKKILGSSQANMRAVNAILVKARDAGAMANAEAEIRSLLRQRHHLPAGRDDDFTLRNLAEIVASQEAASRVLSLLLAAIASVSLVVGGIGIMNIMLVSVTERTREIGLRRAVGARRRDILAQFLTEAIAISCAGGALGVGAGAVGIFFGFYPARKASRLNPIDALRYE